MPKQQDLVLNQRNDETLDLAITDEAGAVEDLAGKTVEIYFKPLAATPDTDDSVITLSSGGADPAIEVTDAANGLATANVPNTDTMSDRYWWWRCDVLAGATRRTALYGSLKITTL